MCAARCTCFGCRARSRTACCCSALCLSSQVSLLKAADPTQAEHEPYILGSCKVYSVRCSQSHIKLSASVKVILTACSLTRHQARFTWLVYWETIWEIYNRDPLNKARMLALTLVSCCSVSSRPVKAFLQSLTVPRPGDVCCIGLSWSKTYETLSNACVYASDCIALDLKTDYINSMPRDSLQATCIWEAVLTAWQEYRTWITKVYSLCNRLVECISAERAAEMMSRGKADTPSLFDMGKAAFRSQVWSSSEPLTLVVMSCQDMRHVSTCIITPTVAQNISK